MLSNIFILLRQELILSLLIFLLLFIKIGKEISNETILNLINILLFVNLAAGLFGMHEGCAFNGMFTTNAFIVLEKNILNLRINGDLLNHQSLTLARVVLNLIVPM